MSSETPVTASAAPSSADAAENGSAGQPDRWELYPKEVAGPLRGTDCRDPVHDWPLPSSYIGASQAAGARLRANWQNPQCPDCHRYGWIPSPSTRMRYDLMAVHAPAGHGPHMLVSRDHQYAWCGGPGVCGYCEPPVAEEEFPDSGTPSCPCGCPQLWSDEFHMWLCPHCDLRQSNNSGEQIRKGDL